MFHCLRGKSYDGPELLPIGQLKNPYIGCIPFSYKLMVTSATRNLQQKGSLDFSA